jgi:pyruvate,water dikinase
VRAAASVPIAGASASAESWNEVAARVKASLQPAQREVFEHALSLARACVRRTEDDDTLLQQASAVVRYALLEAGQRGTRRGSLSEPFELFLLDADELGRALLAGEWPRDRTILERRRAALDAARDTLPPLVIVDGKPLLDAPEGTLKGTPACAGRASGVAFVLHNPLLLPAVLPAGSVVVTPVLTPALAYTLTACAAIVTELGGFASHGAIVARELGIPAVVGVPGATRALCSGRVISVDGSAGTIEVRDHRHAIGLGRLGVDPRSSTRARPS